MVDRLFYGCPNCREPKTTMKHGQYIFINVTAVEYGLKCQVVMNCTACGFVEDITKDVNQVSKQHLDDLLGVKSNDHHLSYN